AVVLPSPERNPVDVHRSWVHSLSYQRAHHTLKAHIKLIFDQRFGHWKVVALHKQLENFLSALRGLALLLRGVEILPDPLPELGETGDSTWFGTLTLACRGVLHEFVVQFGKLLLFDAQNLDCVVVSFSGKLGVGIILRILRAEALCFAGARAAKVFREAFERFFGSDVAEDAVRLYGIATARRRAHQLDERVVAVFGGAALDGHKRGRTIAHFVESLVHLRVAHLDSFDVHFEILVIAELEFGKNFEYSAKFQRLAFLEFNFVYFRARDRDQFFLVERFFEILGDKRLDHFAFNVLREAATNQRDGRLARTKSGNARHAGDIASDLFGRFLDVLGWNFQLDFTFASGFCHGEVLCGRNTTARSGLPFACSKREGGGQEARPALRRSESTV